MAKAIKIIAALTLLVLTPLVTSHATARAAGDQPFKLGVVLYNAADLAGFESDIGRRADIFLWYQSLDETLDTDVLGNIAAGGRTIQLSWEPVPKHSSFYPPDFRLRNFALGYYDDVLHRWARELRDFGHPVLFRPMCEMNGDWTLWSGTTNGNTPADYIAAWRHMHDIFAAEGAVNVDWVWSPNRDGSTAAAVNTFDTLYPGDAYVDYVGFSGYNWGTMYNTQTWVSSWQSFEEVFRYSYDVMTARTNKPFMVSETASTELGGNKAAWITSTFDMLPTRFPRIVSITWFNLVKETDWRVQSSPASLQAFSSGMRQVDAVTNKCGPPGLSLDKSASYWANFADYSSRTLTVDFLVINPGTSDAFNLSVFGSYSNNGVAIQSALPLTVGNVPAGGTMPLQLKYGVPSGVNSYITSTYASVSDSCGSIYRYPQLSNKV